MQKTLLATLLASAGLLVSAAAQADDVSPWLVRVRAVKLNFDNNQSGQLRSSLPQGVFAQNTTIPEVDVSYFVTPNIAAELVLSDPQHVDINLGGSSLGSVKVLPPTLLLQYHFNDLGPFKPYVGAGINYSLFTSRSVTPTIQVDSSSYGLAAQVGFDYMLDQHWLLNVDAKYVQMSTKVTAGGVNQGKLNLNPTLIGVGVGYRF